MLLLSLCTTTDLCLAPSSVIMPFSQMNSLKVSAIVIYYASVADKTIIFYNAAFLSDCASP